MCNIQVKTFPILTFFKVSSFFAASFTGCGGGDMLVVEMNRIWILACFVSLGIDGMTVPLMLRLEREREREREREVVSGSTNNNKAVATTTTTTTSLFVKWKGAPVFLSTKTTQLVRAAMTRDKITR
jgi:hypothetical protein